MSTERRTGSAVFAMLWLNGSYRPVLVAVGLVIKYCLADLTMYLGLAVFGRYPPVIGMSGGGDMLCAIEPWSFERHVGTSP